MDSHKESQKYIEFYFPNKLNQSDTSEINCQKCPCYFFVDKFGTSKECKFYDIFQKLQNGEQPTLEGELNFPINFVKLESIFIVAQNLLALADPQKILEFEFIVNAKLIGDKIYVERPEISYYARDTQEYQLQIILSKLFEIIPEYLWKINKNIQQTISIPYPGKICVVCGTSIINEPQQYYSPFKVEHVCTQCAEADDKQQKGNKRFKYLETLIFINGPLADPTVLQMNLLSVHKQYNVYKIGKNVRLQSEEEGNQSHEFICNFCGTSPTYGPRFISLNTRPGKKQIDGYVEYCYACFQILKDKNSEQAKMIVAQDSKEGMILDKGKFNNQLQSIHKSLIQLWKLLNLLIFE